MRATVVLSCFVVGALFTGSRSAPAQAPQGYYRLTAAEVAESLAVLRMLDSVVRKNRDDAAAWHRRGMVAWALAARDKRQPTIRGIDWTLLDHMADTSLRLAALIEPTNVHYRMAVGRHLASTFGPLNRVAALVQYSGTMKAARNSGNPQTRADAALEKGRLHFRLYESRESARLFSAGIMAALRGAGGDDETRRRPPTEREIRELEGPSSPSGFAGNRDYLEAEMLYSEAFEAVPDHPRAFAYMATLVAARSRWTELASLARGRIATAPWDAAPWMWLGLATHRLGDTRTPVAAFDSALARMSTAEREHIDRLDRVLKPADSIRVAGMTPAERAATERLYWLYADPLWSREGNEPRIEFLARASYAELRWSMPEFEIVGVDSDRGKTHLRYGPARLINTTTVPQGTFVQWHYSTGMLFEFQGYNVIAWMEPDYVRSVIEAAPVRWDNIAPIRVDSMPTQAVRFRADDSVTVLVASRPAVARIRESSEVAAPTRSYFWLMSGGTRTIARDSVTAQPDSVTTFVHRVAQGNYVYRAEASADAARVAGRFTGIIVAGNDSATGFTMSGFGMSDVLLATNVAPTTAAVTRWTDFGITPLAGPAPSRAQVSLVWENYDLAVRDGSARYTIAITLRRERSRVGEIAARIVGAVGIDRTDSHVTIRLDRTVPGTPVVVDHVTLDLDSTPGGTYQLTVEITDAVTGRRTERTTRLVLAD